MDNPALWAVIFLAVAAAFGVGEIAIAGSFFLLPFAIGALVASITSMAGAPVVVSFPIFLIVSFVVFLGFRPLAKRLDLDTPDVAGIGANRLIGVSGSVIEAIPPHAGEAGRVKVGTEEWMADTPDGVGIAAGDKVRVLEVRGTRLVVEPVEPPQF